MSDAVFNDFEALDDVDQVQVMGVPPPAQDRLGALHGVLDMVEGWCRVVRGELERQVMAGITVIGPDGLPMKLIEGRKEARRWRDEREAEAVLTGLLPADKAYVPRKIVSPAAAEKSLGKKATRHLWNDVIVPLITQAPGRPKVVQGSHPAPAYVPGAGAGEFEDLDGGDA